MTGQNYLDVYTWHEPSSECWESEILFPWLYRPALVDPPATYSNPKTNSVGDEQYVAFSRALYYRVALGGSFETPPYWIKPHDSGMRGWGCTKIHRVESGVVEQQYTSPIVQYKGVARSSLACVEGAKPPCRSGLPLICSHYIRGVPDSGQQQAAMPSLLPRMWHAYPRTVPYRSI